MNEEEMRIFLDSQFRELKNRTCYGRAAVNGFFFGLGLGIMLAVILTVYGK